MILLLVLTLVLLIGLTTAAVMGRIGGFMADPVSSQSFRGVPDGPLSTDDVGGLRFDVALRGYRMDQVDEVIDALGARLLALEAVVAARTVRTTGSLAAGDADDVTSDSREQ